MNILLWSLQVLLALHTAMGALWKFSHAPQSVPSLNAIPHPVWLGLSAFELLCTFALLLPALNRSWAILAAMAAVGLALEMLLFSGVHLQSGNGQNGQLVYWLIVAVIGGFIAYGRLVLKPI